jgi:hypothetical protein
MQTAVVLTAGSSKGELVRIIAADYASEIGGVQNFFFAQE